MRLSALASAPGGPASAAGEVPVTEGWGPVPGRQFRAVRYLGFPCGTLAEGVSLVPGAAALRGEFLSLDYDALAPPGPLAAAPVRAEGGRLIVELGGVRRVRRVVLARNARTGGATLALYRLDGDRAAPEPTVRVSSDLWGLDVEREGEEHLAAAAGHAVERAAAESQAEVLAPGAPGRERWKLHGPVAFDVGEDFADAGFALGLETGGGPASLQPADLLSLTVRSEPLNPRLGLARPPESPVEGAAPDRLADLLLLWPDPTAPPGVPTVHVEAGALLEAALGTHLAGAAAERREDGGGLPERLDVALVAAADAPCRLRFDTLSVDWHLERASLEPPAEKAVLRFPAGRVEAQEAAVLVPRGARVTSAVVEASLGRSDGAAAATEAPSPGGGGLAVAEAGWSAQRLDVDQAAVTSGLLLGLLALAGGTEVTAEVREDAGGVPAGRRLAGGTAALGPAGTAGWASVDFGSALLVPSGPLWVCLRARKGRAIWLADPWSPAVVAAQVAAGAETLAVLKGSEAACVLRTAGAPGAEAGGLRLEVAGAAVPCGAAVGGRVAFDAGAALTAAAGQPGAGPVTAILRFAAAPGALLTVYPPRLVYDL